MKMAKASPEEVDGAVQLARLLEFTCCPRNFEMPAFPDTDEDEGAPFDPESKDDLRKLYEELKRLSPGLMRVVFGYHTLLEACCDPEADTLEWKNPYGYAPELLECLQACEQWLSTIPEGRKMQMRCQEEIARATGKEAE